MSLFTVTAQRPGDQHPTTWLFDDVLAAQSARTLAAQQNILLDTSEDFITDFDEFAAWVRREG